jgi:hypothetical protein
MLKSCSNCSQPVQYSLVFVLYRALESAHDFRNAPQLFRSATTVYKSCVRPSAYHQTIFEALLTARIQR